MSSVYGKDKIYIGIDLGTSGCRAIAINDSRSIVARASIALPASKLVNGHITQRPHDWWLACHIVLDNLLSQIPPRHVSAIAVDATSGSVLLCAPDGSVLSDAYMYNDNNNLTSAAKIKQVAPDESTAHGASSGLAKCLSLLDTVKSKKESVKCLNQADWIAGILTQQFNFSDQNNSLKFGYDAVKQQWPSWLKDLGCEKCFADNILAPGKIFTNISPGIAKLFNLAKTTQIVAGTTDGVAAFISSECTRVGESVTSLGSTLVIKLLSNKPIYAPNFGVYSHRLGNRWLVGGASNTGGAVLTKYFNRSQINQLTQQLAIRMDHWSPTGLNYYPLVEAGERFPINDPLFPPVLTPRPKNDLDFFTGILEGISNIERSAYKKLAELGATLPTHIKTVGGGSGNPGWQHMREHIMGLPISQTANSEAAYGTALLARQGNYPIS